MAYSLSMAVMTPALPQVQDGLGTTPAGAAWTLTAMTLSAAVDTPVVGRLEDLYGPRRVLLAVLVVATAGSVTAAVAWSVPVMLLGRALSGICSGVFPLAYTIIRDAVPAARRASAVGLMSSMLGLGGAVAWCIAGPRSEEHTSELQSRENLVCRLLLEKKNTNPTAVSDSMPYTASNK